jgi:hypothetical protein
MPQSLSPDVVIRSRLTTHGTEFMVVCATSSRVLGGPFQAMTDAVTFGIAQAATAKTRLLYEAHDERGRALGERLVLRTLQS